MPSLHNRTTISLAIVCALTGVAPAASANPIQMTFNGAITASNMTAFAVNQQLAVSFIYEASGLPQFISNQQAFYVDHFSSLTLTSGAYNSTDSTGPFGQIDKYDSLANTDGISYEFWTNPLFHQYTNPKPHGVQMASVFSNSVTQTFAGARVNLAGSSNSVWTDYSLPTTYDFSEFDANKSMLVYFSGGSFMAGISSLVVTDLTATTVPEPETYAMMLAGLGLLGFSARRRKAKMQ